MSRIGFIQSGPFHSLFEKEFNILKAAIEVSEGGGIYFVEFSHKEVLSQAAFFLANEILNQGKSIREFLLKDGLLTIEDKKGVVFIYAFIEDIKRPNPTTPPEGLLKKLNAMRERISSSREDFVFWIYKDHVLSFQDIAKDIWIAKRGFYSFILGLTQSLESLPISKEITPVEAAELLNKALIHEKKLKLKGKEPSLYEILHFEKALSSIYERLDLLEQASTYKKSLYKHYQKFKKLENLRKDYLNSIARRYEWLDFKGIRQMKMIVKFRLDEIFIPPKFERKYEFWLKSPTWMKCKMHVSPERLAEKWIVNLKNQIEKDEVISTYANKFGVLTVKFDKKLYEQIKAKFNKELYDECIRPDVVVFSVCEFPDFLKSKKAVVLGDPGSGKSTLLKYLAYKLSTKPEEVGEIKNYFPILFSVADYAIFQRKRELKLEEYLRQRYSDIWPVIQESIKANNTLFLIDGLDEEIDSGRRIQIVRAIEEFVSRYPKNRYIITSRIAGYSMAALSLGFDHFVINPFDKEQILNFLKNWYKAIGDGEEANALFNTIKDSPPLFKLATNPLLLTIMALLHYQGGARLPHRRVDLYTYIIDALAETWNAVRSLSGRPIDLWLGSRRLDRHLAERILSPIAFEIHKKNPGGLMEKAYLNSKIASYFIEYEGIKKPKAEQIAQDFINLIKEQVGILIEKGIDRFSFTHLSFEEYLAAKYLASLENVKEEALKYLYISHFEEVLLLTAGLLSGERAEGFVRAIYEYNGGLDKILKRSLIIATRCLADEVDVRFGLKKRILQDLNKTILTTPYEKLADEIASVYASLYRSSLKGYIEKFLYKDLLEQNPRKGFSILKVLKLKETPAEVLSFIKKNTRDRNILLESLDFLATIEHWMPEIVPVIQKGLKNPDFAVQKEATKVLKKFKNYIPNIISSLERGLKAKDIERRLSAARLLTNLGLKNAKIISIFEKALDVYPEQALNHLYWIDTIPNGLLPKLIKIINNKNLNFFCRLEIALRLFELSIIGELEIMSIYAELPELSKNNEIFWIFALLELSFLPSKKGVPILKKFLKSKKSLIRILAATFLARLGYTDPEVVSLCIEGLQNRRARIRHLSIQCLANYIKTAPELIPISVIEKALENPDSYIRINAAKVLITLGKPPPSIDKMLYGMTKSVYLGVRSSAYELLLQIALMRGHDRIEEAS